MYVHNIMYVNNTEKWVYLSTNLKKIFPTKYFLMSLVWILPNKFKRRINHLTFARIHCFQMPENFLLTLIKAFFKQSDTQFT